MIEHSKIYYQKNKLKVLAKSKAYQNKNSDNNKQSFSEYKVEDLSLLDEFNVYLVDKIIQAF